MQVSCGSVRSGRVGVEGRLPTHDFHPLMSTRGTLRLATRGSDLALRQANAVKAQLEDRHYAVELVEVETRGDQIQDELIHRLGRTGAFVRSLDNEVLGGDVDGAIHSMKDMPTESPDDLVVAGIPERAAPGDCLVTPAGGRLEDLPEAARIGTSSLRRGAQLRHARGDLEPTPLRGNVDTRIEKLLAPRLQHEHQDRLEAEETDDDNRFEQSLEDWFNGLYEIERRALERKPETEYDAIVLAKAGLERSGLLDKISYIDLPRSDFVPAPGQGAIAVTARDDSRACDVIHDIIDDPRSRVETTAERIVLAELGAGCIAPIGVYAVIRGEQVHITAQVLSQDGSDVVAATRDLPIEDYVTAARSFAADLAERGARELIQVARTDEPSEGMRTEE